MLRPQCVDISLVTLVTLRQSYYSPGGSEAISMMCKWLNLMLIKCWSQLMKYCSGGIQVDWGIYLWKTLYTIKLEKHLLCRTGKSKTLCEKNPGTFCRKLLHELVYNITVINKIFYYLQYVVGLWTNRLNHLPLNKMAANLSDIFECIFLNENDRILIQITEICFQQSNWQ